MSFLLAMSRRLLLQNDYKRQTAQGDNSYLALLVFLFGGAYTLWPLKRISVIRTVFILKFLELGSIRYKSDRAL